jgi:hypothetical protein
VRHRECRVELFQFFSDDQTPRDSRKQQFLHTLEGGDP